MKPCPSPEALQTLLADLPGRFDADTLALHVETCPHCQDRLEQLTSAANLSAGRPMGANGFEHSPHPRPGFLARLQQAAPRPVWLSPDAASEAEESDSATRRPLVAGYELIDELGRGAMGVVYRARQRSLNRLVALKMILNGEYAGSEQVARFRREAELIAQLQHPNVVQIYDVGEQDGRPFFTMEFVDGGSLARQLAGTPQDVRGAAELVQTLARAIHAAHQLGIIHRDLKPANILLQRDEGLRQGARDEGRGAREELSSSLAPRPSSLAPLLKITDFGLAKQIAQPTASGERTGSGTILGSPSYMAPEQAQAQSTTIGPAADVYSLGAILYELLTGRPPFRAETPLETVLQVRHEEPVAPRRLRPKLPRDLETICLTCLRKEPHRRYPSAAALAEDLCRFLAGEPIRARPVHLGERLLKWVRRRPAWAALAVVSVAATLCLAAGAAWYNARLREFNTHLRDEVKHRQAQHERATANLHTALDILEHELIKVKDARILGYTVPEPLAQDLLTHAVQFYEKLLAGAADTDPQVRRARGRAYFGLSLSNYMLHQLSQAEAHYQQAVRIQESLLADFPNEVDYRIDLATTLLQWSWHQQVAEQNVSQDRVAALVQSLSPDHPRLANMSASVARKLAGEGKYREALPWLNRHIGVIEALQPRAQSVRTPHIRRILFAMYRTRALLLDELGEYRQALAAWDQALALGEVRDAGLDTAFCRVQRVLTLAHLWISYLRGGSNALAQRDRQAVH